MSTLDFHEATFRWPYLAASDVIVTGSFDSWSRTIHLPRTPSGYFQGNVKVPWGEKTTYKYIVDGRWTTTDNQPTELDPMGNVNNVYTAPTRPFQPKVGPPPTPQAPKPKPNLVQQVKPQTVGQANGILGTAKQAVTQIVEAIAPGTTDLSEDTSVQTPRADPAEVEKEEPKPVEKTVVETPQPAPEPASALPEPSALSPTKEVEPEAVLPAKVKSSDVLPVVPVPLVPLAHEAPLVNGASITLENTVVVNAATSPVKPSEEASTHTPIKLNGKTVDVKPAEVALPPVTPAEAPLPPTPSTEAPLPSTPPPPATATTNGQAKSTEEEVQSPPPPSPPRSAPTTPSGSANTTPHKEKRSTFPNFGTLRRHRHSSSSHSASEHGGDSQPSSPGKESASSIQGSTRKKRLSIFSKIRDVFHHDDHHKKDGSK